jgi:hypothetical protein
MIIDILSNSKNHMLFYIIKIFVVGLLTLL